MNYPLISEYIESIKSAEDNFNQLSSLRPVLDDEGNPIISSGNFAVVFKMTDGEKNYAIKCFTKEQEGRDEAYHMIAEELQHIQSKYICQIEYLPNELFVDSLNSDETEFPILKMDWIEGIPMDKYLISVKYDAYKLSKLVYDFYKLSLWLRLQNFAHGDLKPDNILVSKEHLVLVDYDGMYVPQMSGQERRESGSPNYRYTMQNSLKIKFDKRIDDFAIVQILLSLKVYSLNPSLISPKKDFAIFSETEYSNIFQSEKYNHIQKNNNDRQITILLALFLKLISGGNLEDEDWDLLNMGFPNRKYYNFEIMLCDYENIKRAVNLAYSAMLYKDPARNEQEVIEYKEQHARNRLAQEIQESLYAKMWDFTNRGIPYYCLKPNGEERREGLALPLKEYALRFLFGLVKYLTIEKHPSFVFGGTDEVFVESEKPNKYEVYLERFISEQEQCAKVYSQLYIYDIRNFFKSVDLQRMKDEYFGTSFTQVEWYEKLFDDILSKGAICGLNPCSEVDFFFANLYLQSLDKEMMRYGNIKYYRYDDDIRIFSNNSLLQDDLNNVLSSQLEKLSLKLNSEKTKQINTVKEPLELAKACFVWSCTLYIQTSVDNAILLKGENLHKIIDNDLTFAYLFSLLDVINKRAINANGSLQIHLDNLFYIIRNVHKNSTLYNMTSKLIFDLGIQYDQDQMLFSDILGKMVEILNDKDIEPFVKYWLLRTFFFSDEKYFSAYEEKEKYWKDQYWYPSPCYVDQLEEILVKMCADKNNPLNAHLAEMISCEFFPF